jgi:phosphoribosylamine--glycine ligase
VSAARGELRGRHCRVSGAKAVGVVMASRGYPESAESGQPISGIADAEQTPGVAVYHAGTALRDGVVVTAGGRVLTVVGKAETFEEATLCAYAGVRRISFDGMQYRRDIGRKALQPA